MSNLLPRKFAKLPLLRHLRLRATLLSHRNVTFINPRTSQITPPRTGIGKTKRTTTAAATTARPSSRHAEPVGYLRNVRRPGQKKLILRSVSGIAPMRFSCCRFGAGRCRNGRLDGCVSTAAPLWIRCGGHTYHLIERHRPPGTGTRLMHHYRPNLQALARITTIFLETACTEY